MIGTRGLIRIWETWFHPCYCHWVVGGGRSKGGHEPWIQTIVSLLGHHPDSKLVRINPSLQELRFDIYIDYVWSRLQKVTFFETIKNISWTLSCLRVGPTRTRNQEPRPLLDLFRYHEYNGYLRFGKRTFVKTYIFQSKSDCLDLRETSINYYMGLCFENWAYPWTRVDD